MLQQVQDLKEANSLLEYTINDLKMRLEAVVIAADSLKAQREEIEILFREEDQDITSRGERDEWGRFAGVYYKIPYPTDIPLLFSSIKNVIQKI